ncbi:MAG: ATP-binding protein [Magnetococcus sp. DMHC-6]
MAILSKKIYFLYSIKTKFILLSLILILLSSGWINWISLTLTEESATKNALEAMSHQLIKLMHTVEDFHEEGRNLILLAVSHHEFQDYFSLNETRTGNRYNDQDEILFTQEQTNLQSNITHWILTLQKRYPIVETCLIDKTGQEHTRIVNGKIELQKNFSSNEKNQPFFKAAFALEKEQIYLSEPYISPDAKKWVMAIITPIVLIDGSKPAIYHFEIPLSMYQQLLQQPLGLSSENHWSFSSPDRNNRFVIINQSGLIVADSSVLIDFRLPEENNALLQPFELEKILPNYQSISNHPSFKNVVEQMQQLHQGELTFEENNGKKFYAIFRPLHQFGWSIALIKSEQEMLEGQTSLMRIKTYSTINMLVTLTIAGMVVFFMTLYLTKPLNKLAETAQRIADGDMEATFPIRLQEGEVGVLAGHLARMKERLQQHQIDLEIMVQLRTKTLIETNARLAKTVQELGQTREELIRSEKMASLGRLVAGFAHEINTPIGISIGTVSNIPVTVQRLKEMFLNAEEVDGELLDQRLNHLVEVSNLALSSLTRAADLVSRFKRTSVDQSTEEEHLINLREVIADVIVSVSNRFKKTKIDIHNECPSNINIISYPGVIAQILTNFFMNSLLHGFDNGAKSGVIEVTAQIDLNSKQVGLYYQDNGNGMRPETLMRIFEPFVTTARKSGGTGLGMYICYNLVTNQLKGEIQCGSHPGEGVALNILFPLKIMQNLELTHDG